MKEKSPLNIELKHSILLGAAAFVLAGCTGTKTAPILSDRGIIPAAYREPFRAELPSAGIPLEPPTIAPVEPMAQPIATEPIASIAPVEFSMPEPHPISIEEPITTPALTYTVQKGDSFWKIAKKYGVSYRELAAYNNLALDGKLSIGTELQIPPGGEPVKESSAPKKTIKKSRKRSSASTSGRSRKKEPIPLSGKYTVQSGDSLWVISRRFGVSEDEIRRLNNLKTDRLSIGQTLILKDTYSSKTYSSSRMPSPKKDTSNSRPSPAPVEHTPVVEPAPMPPPPSTIPENGTALGNTSPAAPSTNTVVGSVPHEVNSDDTLDRISSMYEVPVSNILKANPELKSDADLKPGMSINIPF